MLNPIDVYAHGYEATFRRNLASMHDDSEEEILIARHGRQKMVCECDADFVGFGGKPGGNKTFTSYILGYHRHEESILFREEFQQLEPSIIPTGKDLFHEGVAKWNGKTREWRFHKGGRFALGALKYEGDHNRYRGNEWKAMYFDEATEINYEEIMSLLVWMRGKGRQQAYFFFNPPKRAEGRWVIKFFAPWIDPKFKDPAEEGELRWYGTLDDEELILRDDDPMLEGFGRDRYVMHNGEPVYFESRTFYRSDFDENPDLDHRYVARLRNLPPAIRRQMLDGDFTAGLEDDEWQLFPHELVEESMERWKPKDEYFGDMKPSKLTAIGVDPAWGGEDRTVIAKRYGTWVAPLIKVPGAKTPTGQAVADLVIKELVSEGLALNSVRVFIDAIGVGSSPYDALKASGVRVHGINASGATDRSDKSGFYPLYNKRAEMHMDLLYLMEGRKNRFISLPDDDDLRTEMAAIHYEVRNGKIIIESKDEIKKRLTGVSTDNLDAVTLCAMGGGY